MALWETDTGVDVTSAFIGVTTPLRDLTDEIHKRGWTLAKVHIKGGQYVAQGKNPHGEKLEATGKTDATAVGHLLLKIMRQEYARNPHVGAWKSLFTDQLGPIAIAYAESPIYEPRAAIGWKELGDDSMRRAEEIGRQLKVEVVDEPNPYKDLQEMVDDVYKKQHISVSRANPHHPIWTVDQLTAFRLVHDVLGHCASGGDWSWHGANLAFAAHAPICSPEAQKALFTEVLGQGAYTSYYRAYGPQKIAYLDKLLDEAQGKENTPGHTGIHPSQTMVPAEIARIPAEGEKTSAVTPNDPNLDWQSGVTPLPDNGFLWQKLEGQNGWTDPLDIQGVRGVGANLATGWHTLKRGDGSPDDDSAKQAIANAFRAVLLSPRKEPEHGAMHYQALSHLNAGVDDPLRFYDALDQERTHANAARGYRPDLHKLYTESLHPFKQWIKGLNPSLTDADVDNESRRELLHMQAEEEERLAQDDPDNRFSANDLEREAQRELARRLKVMTKGKADERHDFAEDRLFFSAAPHDAEPYPAFLAHTTKSMAAVGHRINDLLMAARHDMNMGGSGHRFRHSVLGYKLPGVGPKEISHAWMLLSPHTSELGVMSPQLLEALDHPPEHMNPRDYYKFERELATGRDAAGYSHVPLGLFGSGLYDHLFHGPGVHQDYSALRPLSPKTHTTVQWEDQPKPSSGSSQPYWWESTSDQRKNAAQEWDRNVAVNVPSTEIPFVKTATGAAAFSTTIPFFVHPTTGESFDGKPGQSIMGLVSEALGYSPTEAWANPTLQVGKR